MPSCSLPVSLQNHITSPFVVGFWSKMNFEHTFVKLIVKFSVLPASDLKTSFENP